MFQAAQAREPAVTPAVAKPQPLLVLLLAGRTYSPQSSLVSNTGEGEVTAKSYDTRCSHKNLGVIPPLCALAYALCGPVSKGSEQGSRARYAPLTAVLCRVLRTTTAIP